MRPAVFCASGLVLFFCSLPFFMRPLSRVLRRCKKSSLSLPASMKEAGLSLPPRRKSSSTSASSESSKGKGHYSGKLNAARRHVV